jgi:hypothetical protein
VDCGVAHVIAPDQLVPGIRVNVVFVAVEAPPMLLGPAGVLILLPVLGRFLLPRRGSSATLDCLVFLARVPLSSRLLKKFLCEAIGV